MPIWPGCTFGKSGRARAPERLVNSVGIQTLVMKLRFVQSLPGRSFTRFDFFAPPEEVWRTIFRFLEKGFGTVDERYKRAGSNQTLNYPESAVGIAVSNTPSAAAAEGRRKFRSGVADWGADRARRPKFESVGRVDRRRRMRWGNCARRISAAVNSVENRE